MCTAGGGLTTYCSTTVGSTSASSPSSSSSGDSEYPPSSQGPEDDDDAFMGGNANAASDSLCAPYRKRAYVFATRRRRAKPLKERLFQSVTRGLIQSEERLALEISDCCVCKTKSSIAFVEEPGLLSELLRCRNEFHSLRKHSDRRMYLRSLLTLLTGLIHLSFHVCLTVFIYCSHWSVHFAGHPVLCQLHSRGDADQLEPVLRRDRQTLNVAPNFTASYFRSFKMNFG